MLTLIENGRVYDPEPRGVVSLLLANDRVEKIGEIERRFLDALDVEYDVIDAEGCVVTPGFVDPHEHLLGGSGEGGFALQTPMLFPREILRAGITTVVGLLGVDTTMKTLAGLLARVRALKEDGLSAWMWSGGYNVPPTTVLDSIRKDVMFIDEVVGAGELAISDERGLNQSAQELAKVVRDTHVGGLLSGKAGISHFHVGEEDTRLQPLRDLIEQFQVRPEWLYPTHCQRNATLLREAVELANAGSSVDFDVVEQDAAKWVKLYLDEGGPIERLTLSSDADSATPDIYFEQFQGLVTRHDFALEVVLPLVTSNAARILKLEKKGRLVEGCDADVLVIDEGAFEIRDVIARGRRVVKNGEPTIRDGFLEKSKRAVVIDGDEMPDRAKAFLVPHGES